MRDIVKTIIDAPPVLFLCVGLILILVSIIGKSPVSSLHFSLGPLQRVAVLVLGLPLVGFGLYLLAPKPSWLSISGLVVEKKNKQPVAEATVEAHEDAKSDQPTNKAVTDDNGRFYLNYGNEDKGKYVRLKVVKERFKSSSLGVLIGTKNDKLPFELESALEGPTETGPPGISIVSEAPLNFTPLYKGELNLWISSRPENFSPRLLEEFHKDFPSFALRDKNITPEAFVNTVFGNPKGESYPDVAFIDNFSQLSPLSKSKAIVHDWGQGRFEEWARGWWVIFKDSQHIEQARAFFVWLSRGPHWQPMRVKNTSLNAEQIQNVQWVSIDALHRVLTGDAAGLAALSDKEAANFRLRQNPPSFKLTDTQAILTFGNTHTAFVILAAVGSGENEYGVSHHALILRRGGGDWRILYFAFNIALPRAEDLFHEFDYKMTSERGWAVPARADLVGPPDKARLPRFPTRPTIEWTVANSANLSFLVEVQVKNDGGDWWGDALSFVEPSRVQNGFAVTAPFGVGMQPHRWRIWTLNPSGGIAISDWREIDFTN